MPSLAVTFCVAVSIFIAQVPSAPSLPASPQVEIELTKAHRLIYLEHKGPYWSAGAKFAEVRAYMQLHHEPGPLFMRHFRNRTNRSRTKEPGAIGFFTKKSTSAMPPFRTETVSARRVARLIVEGKASVPQRSIRTIQRWAAENGHSTSDEVLEVYYLAAGDRGRIERTEFQLPIVADSVDQPAPVTKSRSWKRPKLPTDEPRPRPTQIARTEPVDARPRPAVAPQAPSKRDLPVESLRALVRAGRYQRVAELVLPNDNDIDQHDQAWIGPVFFRIKAAGKGMARTDAKSAVATLRLSESLLERYVVVFQDKPSKSLMGAGAPANDSGRRAVERRKIMRRLDSLLGRIAFGLEDREAVEDELVKILTRIRDTLAEPTEE